MLGEQDANQLTVVLGAAVAVMATAIGTLVGKQQWDRRRNNVRNNARNHTAPQRHCTYSASGACSRPDCPQEARLTVLERIFERFEERFDKLEELVRDIGKDNG